MFFGKISELRKMTAAERMSQQGELSSEMQSAPMPDGTQSKQSTQSILLPRNSSDTQDGTQSKTSVHDHQIVLTHASDAGSPPAAVAAVSSSAPPPAPRVNIRNQTSLEVPSTSSALFPRNGDNVEEEEEAGYQTPCKNRTGARGYYNGASTGNSPMTPSSYSVLDRSPLPRTRSDGVHPSPNPRKSQTANGWSKMRGRERKRSRKSVSRSMGSPRPGKGRGMRAPGHSSGGHGSSDLRTDLRRASWRSGMGSIYGSIQRASGYSSGKCRSTKRGRDEYDHHDHDVCGGWRCVRPCAIFMIVLLIVALFFLLARILLQGYDPSSRRSARVQKVLGEVEDRVPGTGFGAEDSD